MPTIYSDSGGLEPLGPTVTVQTAKVAMLLALIDTGIILDGTEVDLYTNDLQPNEQSVTADFIRPTWTGYADKAVVWGTPVNEGANGATVEGVSVNWISNADADTLIHGWIVKDAGGDLVYARKLEEPLAIFGVMSITIVPAYSIA